ncbi:MAG TPA: RDD family protein [Candidatus Kapabacteria bacterium]|nr:RDD family protein [Ignavibacteria bacterium]HRE58056.1 RDD family protein [Candidatus Kapabacteria bacterium]
MNTIRIITTQNVELEYELASLGTRIGGYIIDMCIQGGLTILFYIIIDIFNKTLGFEYLDDNDWIMMIFLLPYLLVSFYSLICESVLNGQTVGKLLLKTRVVKLDGSQPTFGAYLLRWLVGIIDFGLCSGVVALITFLSNKNGQRLGDIAAGTTVISIKPRVTVEEVTAPNIPMNYLPIYPEVKQLSDRDMAIINDVIHTSAKQDNEQAVAALAEKLKQTLSISSSLSDKAFIQTIVRDYYYYTAE